MRRRTNSRALTLLEVVIAIMLIALLLGALLTFVWQSVEIREQAAARSDRTQIARQVLDTLAAELRGCLGSDEVRFPVEAGSLLLARDPSRLRGQRGEVLIVDVLVYGRVPRVKALLTGRDGVLIASAERRLTRASREGAAPRTVALEIAIPRSGVPDRGRLHLLGLDRDGMELEHIDSTVAIAP